MGVIFGFPASARKQQRVRADRAAEDLAEKQQPEGLGLPVARSG